MKKSLEFIKEKIINIAKVLCIVVAALVVAVCMLNVHNKVNRKCFTAMTFEFFNKDGSYLNQIYKYQNKYLLINRSHNIVIAELLQKVDKEPIFSILETDVESKIGKFSNSFQLNNGNIVFYNITSNCVTFTIFNINSGLIVRKFNGPKLKSWREFGCVYAINDNEFLFTKIENNYTRNVKYIPYRYSNGYLKEISNPNNISICDGAKISIPIDNHNFLFFGGECSGNLKYPYIFNSINNTFDKLNIGPLMYLRGEKPFYRSQFLPLGKKQFLYFDCIFKNSHNIKNIIILYKVNGLNLKEVQRIELDNLNFILFSANIIQLNNEEILIVGGNTGKLIGPNRRRAYIINLKNKQLIKLGNMNYKHSFFMDSILKIDNNKILIYRKLPKQKFYMEMHERN